MSARTPCQRPQLRLAAVLLGLGLSAGSAQAASGGSIGAIVPESWPSKAQAEELRRGMQLALKTWPTQPAPTLTIQDSACDPRRAASATQDLIAAKVDVVLGNWCEIGAGAELLRGAGIALVSANAERIKSADHQLQFGRIELFAGEELASQLRRETGLRISARTSCWMDFEARVPDKIDAVLCPVLLVDRARWDQVAGTYTAAYRQPFTVSAARGYAAMEVALAYVRRLRSGATPAAALRETQAVRTILGPLPAADARAPDATMQLMFASSLPKLTPPQSQAVAQLMQRRDCGRSGSGQIPAFRVRVAGAPDPCANPVTQTAQR